MEEKRPTMRGKETYRSKRDLPQRQKRPVMEEKRPTMRGKETYIPSKWSRIWRNWWYVS
jgi:hypothetical protein